MDSILSFRLHTQCISLLIKDALVLVLAIAVATDTAAIRRNSPEITRESQQNLNLTNSSNIELGSGSPDIQPVVNKTSTCNCSSSNVSSPVCGSDGLTYSDECALQRRNCIENRRIVVKSIGRCSFNCTKDREMRKNSSISIKRLRFLLANCPTKTAKIQDLLPYPFVPTCSNDDPTLYAPVQHLSQKYCPINGVYWCSTPDGMAIESSLSWGHQPDCGSRKGCLNEGVNYNDGEVFTSSSCGICECLNGSIKCIRDFCNTTEGSLSDYQLGLLKSDMLHLFHFQFQQRQHILIDLHHIRRSQLAFTNPKYTDYILKWKFNRYDQNDNDNLDASETYHLVDEIVDLIGTKPKNLTSQLRGCMDETQNGSVSEAEWMAYFKTNVCEGSGGNSGEASRTTRSASRNFRDSTSD